ncbi:MAG TPA: DUF202 domain-containing protein [Streptomyces sp.]|nr:DUF202 domain-containing protein [Streptomyces sp.]
MSRGHEGYGARDGRSGTAGTVRDPAAQPERTRLAWRRTSLAFTIVVLLATRGGVRAGSPAAYAAVALGMLVWLMFLVVTQRRLHALTVAGRSSPLGTPTAVAAVACTLALPVCGVVVLR